MSKYGTAAKFRAFALRDEAVAGYTDDELEAFIESASGEADTYLASRYLQNGPLTSWGPELEKAVFKIARLEFLGQRGADPSNPADMLLVKAYDDAIRWLRDVQASRASLVVTTTAPAASPMPRVFSQPKRGW